MTEVRRVIRRAPIADQAADDLHWPMDVALIVLGGFLLGVALALLRFDDPRWLLSARTWLIAIPVLVIASLVASRMISRRWMRRTMQFALLASMLIHLGLLVAIKNVEVGTKTPTRVARNEDVMRRKARRMTRDFSSYRFAHQGNRRPDFARPVETEAPTPPVEILEPQRSVADQSPLELQPQPVVEPQPTAHPSIVNKQRTPESMPRRREHPAQLSRNLRPRLAAEEQAERLAEAPARAPQPEARPEASATEMEKRSTAPAVERSAANVPEQQQVARQTPRAEPHPPGQATATAPQLERARNSSQPAVATDASRSNAPLQPQTPPRLAPRDEPTERLANATPPTLGRIDADIRAATEIARSAQRRENNVDRQPLVAATPDPAQNRQPRRTERSVTSVPTESATAAVERPARGPTEDPVPSRSPETTRDGLRPTPSEVARQNVPTPALTTERQQPRDEPLLSRTLESARTPSLRAVESPLPTVAAQQRPTPAPQRALRDAPLASSPVPVESPAVQVAEPAPATAAPAPTALARATDGTAGAGYSPNLDRLAPSADSPAATASGAATRARATRAENDPLALSPSSRAPLGRSRADAPVPGSQTDANTEVYASKPAAPPDGSLQAAASASLQQAATRAELGAVSAEPGTLQVDVGPPRVIPQMQNSRGSGGGQPEINLAQQRAAESIARSGSSQAALDVDSQAATIEAPRGDGGAMPLALDASPAATAPARTDAGGDSRMSGEPAAAALAGPVAEPNQSELLGASQLRRAERPGLDAPFTAGDVAASEAPRAEAADAAAGDPLPGGGRQPLQRSSRSVTIGNDSLGAPLATFDAPLPSTTSADVAAMPLAAGVSVERRETGTALPDGPLNQEVVSPSEPGRLAGTAERPSRPGNPGDELVEHSPSETLVRRQLAAGPATAAADPLAALNISSTAPPASASQPALELADRDLDGALDRLAASLPVEVDALPGPGGLEAMPARDVGLDDRRAAIDSVDIQSRLTRFPRRDVGGEAQLNPAPVVAAEAFRQRMSRRSGEPGGNPLSPETEKAIEMGLIYLARQQFEDGRWSLTVPGDERPAMNSDTAATALALLAFQGAGYTHKQDHYARVVQAGLDLLVAAQDEDGCLYLEADEESNRYARLYSHGIATLALCEAYGMTQDPDLREPAQRAIDFIVATQEENLGGWRYTPNYSSDTSVTGWMMMALKSGELAGLEIPQKTYAGIVKWLDRAQASPEQPHLYVYNPEAPDTVEQRHGRKPSATMTAVGLLMRLYTGWDRSTPQMQAGAKYLRDNLPALGGPADPLLSRQRDTYYWYYATQVMFHMGGEDWRAWNGRLYPLLINTQILTGPMAGSWDPLTPVPDRWAGHAGRNYVTALNLLSLEVHYRHLPLYIEPLGDSP